jgi:hypothetical protein
VRIAPLTAVAGYRLHAVSQAQHRRGEAVHLQGFVWRGRAKLNCLRSRRTEYVLSEGYGADAGGWRNLALLIAAADEITEQHRRTNHRNVKRKCVQGGASAAHERIDERW